MIDNLSGLAPDTGTILGGFISLFDAGLAAIVGSNILNTCAG